MNSSIINLNYNNIMVMAHFIIPLLFFILGLLFEATL
jgi:hypothetical protein